MLFVTEVFKDGQKKANFSPVLIPITVKSLYFVGTEFRGLMMMDMFLDT